MIDLYSWGTPNGHKVHIMLEECGLEHRLTPVDIAKGEQLLEPFSSLGPNRKIPLMVDPQGPSGQPITLFESGAILIYLAEKTGQFLPDGLIARYQVLQWLMFQMSAVGPMMGQSNHFLNVATEPIPYAVDRFGAEVRRIHVVMERHLAANGFFGGELYSIADMAIFPWLRASEKQGISWSDHPRLHKWFNDIGQRPAVQRGLRAFTAPI